MDRAAELPTAAGYRGRCGEQVVATPPVPKGLRDRSHGYGNRPEIFRLGRGQTRC